MMLVWNQEQQMPDEIISCTKLDTNLSSFAQTTLAMASVVLFYIKSKSNFKLNKIILYRNLL